MKILLFFLIFNLVACASYFKRKECESTNWFNYGQSVALEGRRLTGDQFISECNQAEADVRESDLDRGFKSGMQKYCEPETVFQIGKNGNFFSSEMCTGQGLNVLHAQHRVGVIEYCQKSNAYSAGTKGKAYNKICPANLETSFLPEFNRGRKRYLGAVLAENQKMMDKLDHELASLQSDLRFKTSELQRYQYMTNKDEKFLNRVGELNRETQSLDYLIREKQTEQNRLRSKNREVNLELVKLD